MLYFTQHLQYAGKDRYCLDTMNHDSHFLALRSIVAYSNYTKNIDRLKNSSKFGKCDVRDIKFDCYSRAIFASNFGSKDKQQQTSTYKHVSPPPTAPMKKSWRLWEEDSVSPSVEENTHNSCQDEMDTTPAHKPPKRLREDNSSSKVMLGTSSRLNCHKRKMEASQDAQKRPRTHSLSDDSDSDIKIHETLPSSSDWRQLTVQSIDPDWQRRVAPIFNLDCNITSPYKPTMLTPTRLHVRVKPAEEDIHDVDSEGNCLFCCLSHVTTGTQDHHMDIRGKLCQFIRENRDKFRFYTGDKKSIEENEADWVSKTEMSTILYLMLNS